MKQRIITGIIMAIIFIPVLLCTTMEMFMGVVGFLAVVATYEMLKMFKSRNELGKTPTAIVFILSIETFLALSLLWYFNKNAILNVAKGNLEINELTYFFMGFAIIGMINMLVIGAMMVFAKTFNSEYAGRCFLIINYVGISFAAVAILRMYGRGMILYLFIVACLTDIFAYTVGMNFGKHKMSPVISPKKSWEGSIGGTVIATIFASLFAINYKACFSWLDSTAGESIISNFTNFSRGVEITVLIGLTLATSIVGQIGDLVASKMKRDNEIKDYGTIFPGHGGVLDRFDSAIFNALFLSVICTIFVIAL